MVEFMTPEEQAKSDRLRHDAWRKRSVQEWHDLIKYREWQSRKRVVMVIDATDYPLVKVLKPLSSKGISGDEPLDLGEELGPYFWEFYDYQPEDLEG